MLAKWAATLLLSAVATCAVQPFQGNNHDDNDARRISRNMVLLAGC
jgi:hypothetical protein